MTLFTQECTYKAQIALSIQIEVFENNTDKVKARKYYVQKSIFIKFITFYLLAFSLISTPLISRFRATCILLNVT